MVNKSKDNDKILEQVMKQSNIKKSILIIFSSIILLIILFIISIIYGAASIDLTVVLKSFTDFNPQIEAHQIIRELRIPRIIGAAIVGSSFAVSGAMMQGMTRNPLAESGLLGLNAGAVFMLAICFAFFPNLSYIFIILFSFLGAGLGAAIVFGVGSLSKNGLTPMRIILAGIAVTALFTALSEAVAIRFKITQDIAFWYAGGVSGTSWYHLKIIVPILIIALIGAMSTAKSITILSLGKEVAIGLGQNIKTTYLIANIIIFIMSGIAVAIVGAVSFVGLIIPHIVRYFVGYDYRWIIPISALFGAIFVVMADFVARTINIPFEFPIGALIALIGVPFFLYLARKGGGVV